jgi:predicted component of type VI protein secretion system
MPGNTVHGSVRMWLTVFAGQVPTDTLEISGPRFLVGREENCDLVLDDPKVSREHAEFVAGTGPLRILRDLGSANGTLVNGRPLRPSAGFAAADVKETQLSGDEWLLFGDTVARITLVDPRQLPEQVPRSDTDTAPG